MNTRVKRQLRGQRLADIAQASLRLRWPTAHGAHNKYGRETFTVGAAWRQHGPPLGESLKIVSTNKLPDIVNHARAIGA